jgi:DNA-binding transcriptional MerR regulator
MKPDWDKLMKNWNKGDRKKTSLIADVDCTTEGKALCEQVGVQGYPTIKWGDPSSLEDYEGGRDYESLKKFAKQNLKPMCSPMNIDLCDEAKKAEISKLQAMPLADLEKQIEEKKKEIKTAEETFDAAVKKLQSDYEQLQKDKEEKIKAVKDSGLGLMNAVQAAAKKAKEEL